MIDTFSEQQAAVPFGLLMGTTPENMVEYSKSLVVPLQKRSLYDCDLR
ncbi:MAG TPA: hypothetical protein VN376_05345 [Longilinea sp.]|nr:hypothetical protein [Longilinea sp.]